jgi:integrase
LADSLPQAKLEELKATLHKVYKRRFKVPKEPKYGSINKAFTELELQHFLRNVKSEKFRLLFKYQAFLGLRVGEVCQLHVSNINFDKRELTIQSEKSHKMNSLIIPSDLFKETIEYMATNSDSIKTTNGYVFFKDNDNNHNKVKHIEVNYARKVFRETIKVVGLDSVYGHSDEAYSNHKERRLFRLSTHSLRHYAITRFAKSTNGNVVLTSRFARHSRPDVTMTYISKDNEQLYKEIDLAFSIEKINKLKLLSSP